MSSLLRARSLDAAFVLLCGMLWGPLTASATTYDLGCQKPPYNVPHASQLTDPAKNCPNGGTPKTGEQLSAAHEAQNVTKNNLCASGPIHDISLPLFDELQHALDTKVAAGELTYGDSDHLPDDRGTLTHIPTSAGLLGEGDRVQLVGYVKQIVLHGSNESCTCRRSADRLTDIHLYLVDDPDAEQCASVVAELIPHYRPPLWTHRNVQQLEGNWIRITGQLFMDGSHRPCRHGTPASPARRSVWEVHPVYTVEVCISESCDTDTEWMGLNDWLSVP